MIVAGYQMKAKLYNVVWKDENVRTAASTGKPKHPKTVYLKCKCGMNRVIARGRNTGIHDSLAHPGVYLQPGP